MFEHLDDVNPPQPGPRERARVFNRADELVRRRRTVTGLSIAVAILLVVAIPGVFAVSGGGGQTVQTASAPTTSPTTTELPAVVTPVTETVPPTTTTSTPPPSTTAKPRATTSTIVCRNSSNPACGSFRWDPPPAGDQPATMTITWSPAQPKAGEKITFRVVIDDPDDASLAYMGKFLDYGEANGQVMDAQPPPSQDPCASRYGPWTPPAPAPGHYDEEGGPVLEHTYAAAGSYPIKFSYVPAGNSQCVDPYVDGAHADAVVNVSP